MNHDNRQSLNCTQCIQRIGISLWVYLILQVAAGFLTSLPLLFGWHVNTTVFMAAAVLCGLPALALGLVLTGTRITGLSNPGHPMVETLVRAVPMTFFWSIGFSLLWALLGTSSQELPPVFSMADKIGMFFIIGVIGPVIEELFFRGFAYNCLKRYSPVFAAVISSLAFSFLHMNFTQGIPVFFMALVFCWAYEQTGSLWVPILLHVINNSMALLVGWFPLLIILLLVLAVLGLVVTILMVPAIREAWHQLMEKRALFRCVWKAPLFWLVGVAFVGFSLYMVVAR